MPWSLPQELIVHRPFWQYQFSCNFSMCPWRWAKNIQHLVQQSGLTTDSVYPDKSQWYYQYSKEKRLPDIYCTGNSRCIQTKSTGANRVSCSSSVELADDDVRMIPSASPSKLSKTICSDFFDPPHIYIIYIYSIVKIQRTTRKHHNKAAVYPLVSPHHFPPPVVGKVAALTYRAWTKPGQSFMRMTFRNLELLKHRKFQEISKNITKCNCTKIWSAGV